MDSKSISVVIMLELDLDLYYGIELFYHMAQVTSGKIARCDWFLTWRDFSVMTAGIMKIVNCPVNKNKLKILKKISKQVSLP